MADSTLTTFDAFMKEYYVDGVAKNVAEKDHALVSLMPKSDGFVGDVLPVPVLHGNPTARSRVFATAATAALQAGTQRDIAEAMPTTVS